MKLFPYLWMCTLQNMVQFRYMRLKKIIILPRIQFLLKRPLGQFSLQVLMSVDVSAPPVQLIIEEGWNLLVKEVVP